MIVQCQVSKQPCVGFLFFLENWSGTLMQISGFVQNFVCRDLYPDCCCGALGGETAHGSSGAGTTSLRQISVATGCLVKLCHLPAHLSECNMCASV